MLDNFGPSRMSWTRRVVFITSIVLHAGAAIGLIIYSVLHVEELAPPEVTLTFFNAPPPPPPPPPPAGNNQKKSTPKKTVVPKIPNPNSLKEPKKVEKEEPKEQAQGEPGGVAGGVQGGVAGGVVGGVVGAPPPPAPPPPPPPAPAPPKVVPSFVFDKERLSAPDPHISEDYKNRHPKSTATGRYRMCVGQDGHLSEVSVLQPIGGTEDDNIIRQLRGSWLYKPQPLPICTVRVFTFIIN